MVLPCMQQIVPHRGGSESDPSPEFRLSKLLTVTIDFELKWKIVPLENVEGSLQPK